MVQLYLRKILNKEINPNTNEIWKLEDVPLIWRTEVETLLETR